jgi:hypothetical protein
MLTREYISSHSDNIHTFESFARAIVGMVMSKAEREVGEGQKERVRVEGSFTIEAFGPRNCIRICYVQDGVSICIHING